MGFLTWLQESAFAQFLGGDPYAYPILLCFHAIGMAAVVGIVWVMSLRVLGYAGAISLTTFGGLSRIALAGFGLNAVSGLLIFSTEATRAISDTEFQIKMAAILVGAVTVWAMSRAAGGTSDGERFSPAIKGVAAVSSLAWLVAIIAGRYVAYTIAPPI